MRDELIAALRACVDVLRRADGYGDGYGYGYGYGTVTLARKGRRR